MGKSRQKFEVERWEPGRRGERGGRPRPRAEAAGRGRQGSEWGATIPLLSSPNCHRPTRKPGGRSLPSAAAGPPPTRAGS